ncbi:NAD(P)-dependent dehydrogenase (short-subunit alcohol dehydrogenase family) [Catenuloplanes nepalensis]|uniref:NAD(P)-dependent dehydrogenase (Short-subunit alcohol dehydrogenase family) n=1 Tax=Catenuloplanes nepalensis TaxID=587533 RepID=A0ABT9MWT7_9ACTN|nr:SDR family oxidoreductase [Catenuloplanes nepalensis]MDP9795907.1 NAD(P)-dependent dehydrogenase (short-subunit alcohol dehydrogenase family) [Catenuloplanes nepalensis]
MNLTNAVALVTGANRGLGRHFAQELLARGAAKVYATARRPEAVELPGVEVIGLDVTDPARVSRAAEIATDVTLLVNNAGNSSFANLVDGDEAEIRGQLDVFFWGPLRLVRAFAPILRANGGGGIININSAMSWVSGDRANAYHVAKAAQWAMTNAVRHELAGQGTHVAGAYFGMTDTGHQDFWNGPLNDAAEIARRTLDAFEKGQAEIIPDELGAGAKAMLAETPRAYPTPE